MLSVHKRKRVTYKCEPYPNPNRLIRFTDYGVTSMGVVMAFATGQQALIIWQNQSAVDVSLMSWVFFLISATLYSLYGYLHKDWPIFIGSFLLVFIDLSIVIGILLYG